MTPKKTRLFVELLEVRATPSASTSTGYDYSRLAIDKRLGGSDVAPTTPLRGGLALEGGGGDIAKVFTWMAEHGGKGDFLLIGSDATTSGNYFNNPVKTALGSTPINSISTLMVSSQKGANSSFVVDIVNKAEAIFILGGDQATYVNGWGGTGLADAIGAAAKRGVPVGGTSAGLAVLGQYAYNAFDLGTTSSIALNAPQNVWPTITQNFLNSNSATITSATESGNVVTITTNLPLNYTAGQHVRISGLSIAGYNGGTFVLTPVSVTATTSTYKYVANQSNMLPSTGTGVVANIDAAAALPGLENTITDSHVYQRDRLGRTVAFVASIAAHSPVDTNGQLLNRVKGIAVDQDTALLIETKDQSNGPGAGTALVVSNTTDPTGHSVHFLESPRTAPTIPATGALVYSGVLVHRAAINEAVSLPQLWTGLSYLETATSSTNSSDYLLETLATSTGTLIKKRFWLGGALVDDVY